MRMMDICSVYDNKNAELSEDCNRDEFESEFYGDDAQEDGESYSKKTLKPNYRYEMYNLIKNELDMPSFERGAVSFEYDGRNVIGVPMGMTGSGKVIFDINGKLESFHFEKMIFAFEKGV